MKKIAIVTGASRGIGRAIAVQLAQAGYEVHGGLVNVDYVLKRESER